eukprot:GFUD01004395.1.p1 GENE.GFUD01004395.1~~GFUD01004395.1.p1  ORF type:complete len:147 (+),score=40.10 GFUD01004395.1:27-467(+)
MAFTSGSNVWGNTYRQNSDKSVGPFGSRNNFGESNGPSSLPAFSNQGHKSNIYSFETSSSSSSGSNSGTLTRTNSNLSLGTESKKFSWTGPDKTFGGSSSGSSSNSSNSSGSSRDLDKRLDWGKLVDNVFKQEIGKLSEGYRNGMY